MIGCLRTRVRKQPIISLYFESENELKFYNLEARSDWMHSYVQAVTYLLFAYDVIFMVHGLFNEQFLLAPGNS